MFETLSNELNQLLNNFDKNKIFDYQLLLITSKKINFYFNEEENNNQKLNILTLYKNIMNKFNLFKELEIIDLNELFNPIDKDIEVDNINNYITLFNLIFQEWDDNNYFLSSKIINLIEKFLTAIENNLNNSDSDSDKDIKKIEEYPVLDDIIIKNKEYLREYIIRKKLIKYKCNCCGLSSWQNNPLMLKLHSKNNIYTNLNLNNLEFLCPNCYSQIGE